MKRVHLELGGKSPHIIFADAENLEKAIERATFACIFQSGQVCFAGSRLYVEESIYSQVLEGVKQICQNTKPQPNTVVGPLISEGQLRKVDGLVKSGVEQGAKVEAGGNIYHHESGGYYFEPTVLTNVNQDMKVVQEEIFGPVICVQPFKNLEEVIEKANNTRYGLASGIWTKDIKKAHRAAAQIKAGTVWINCYGVTDVAVPLPGFKQSGWGVQFGQEGFEEYL